MGSKHPRHSKQTKQTFRIDKLGFRTEYKNTKEYLIASELSFVISVFLLAFSSLFSYFSFYKSSYFLFFGALVYEIYFIYLLHHIAEKGIKKYKKPLSTLLWILNKLVYVLILATIVILLILRNPHVQPNKLAALAALTLIVLPLLLWEKLMSMFKRMNKRILFFLLIPMLVMPLVLASDNQTSSLTQTLEVLSQTVDTIGKIIKFIADVKNFFNGIVGWLTGLGLSTGNATLIILIIILFFVWVALKYVRIILKWIMVGLIIWIILSILGVV